MSAKRTTLRLLRSKATSHLQPSSHRSFSAATPRQTDGVFTALTNERVQTPWVEAFRKQQAEKAAGEKPSAGQPSVPKERDLTPRKMSDSYHSVVCMISLRYGVEAD